MVSPLRSRGSSNEASTGIAIMSVDRMALVAVANALVLGLVLPRRIVWIAVQPALTWLRGGDHGMTAAPGVLAGVLVRRRITAARDAAVLTRPQVNPSAADRYTFLAYQLARRPDRFDRRDVGAGCLVHGSSSLFRFEPGWLINGPAAAAHASGAADVPCYRRACDSVAKSPGWRRTGDELHDDRSHGRPLAAAAIR